MVTSYRIEMRKHEGVLYREWPPGKYTLQQGRLGIKFTSL